MYNFRTCASQCAIYPMGAGVVHVKQGCTRLMDVFPVLIYKDRSTAYRAEVPDLPTCQVIAPNLSVALKRVREAAYVQLEAMLMEGKPLPKPSDLMVVHKSSERAGAVALTAIEIDMSRMSTEVERVNITLPKWLVSRIQATTTNRSRFLADSAIKVLQEQSAKDGKSPANNRLLASRGNTTDRQESKSQDQPLTSHFSWLNNLPDEVSKAIRDKMYRRKLPRNSYLFRAGQWDGTLFYIVSGAVQLKAISQDGKESLLTIHRAGACIGVTTALCPLTHVYDAVATRHSVVDCLAQNEFQELRQIHSEIDRAIAEWSAHRIWELLNLMLGAMIHDLPRRLASHVDYLLEPDSSQQETIAKNQLRISQEVLATAVGASRQAVGKVLREWNAAGIVDVSYRRVKILDRNALKSIATN